AAVIEPEPLAPTDAAAYLRACLPPNPGPAWDRVLAVLGSGPSGPLADALTTPLNVWLVREVYVAVGRDPTGLLDPYQFPDLRKIRYHLLDQFIPAVLATRPAAKDHTEPFRPRRDWKPDDVRRWLGYLADHLQQRGTRDFAWWHLARHTVTPRTLETTVRTAIVLMCTLIFGVAGGLEDGVGVMFGVVAGVVVVFVFGVVFGVVFGAVAGVVLVHLFGPAAGLWLDDEPGYANLDPYGRKTHLAYRLASGTSIGLLAGFGLLLMGVLDLPGAFTFWLIAPVFVLFEWAESPALTGRVNTPGSSWRADRRLTLLRTLALGLMSGLVFGLVFGRVDALVFGLAIGLGLGLRGGKHHAWVVYVFATFRLAGSGLLPRRLMAFLDDAHRMGLLRAVGPVYQFRHADLQDHLAAAHWAGTSTHLSAR
ncbi:MAG TPA: hypothetical protein VIS06_13605, partial [Mycobacteriales bacterium]